MRIIKNINQFIKNIKLYLINKYSRNSDGDHTKNFLDKNLDELTIMEKRKFDNIMDNIKRKRDDIYYK